MQGTLTSNCNKSVKLHCRTIGNTARMAFGVTLGLLSLATCYAAPADGPVRIDLPVYDSPEPQTDVYLVKPLTSENYPGGEPIKTTQTKGGNILTHKLEATSDLLANTLNAKEKSYVGGIFSPPVTIRESALEETEGYASKILSIKENVQALKAGIFHPKPIVDTITEDEKYGNTGDKFYTTGKALVGGAENISNFLNSFLGLPGSIFKNISRSTSEKLNNLGGKLIGL